jgi:dTDP-4-dehydrorhamnose reductase
MARIAVIGAAGYVGMELCRQLKEAGHEVIGIARSNGKFLLQPLGIRVEHPSNADAVGEVDAVINLAYPNTGSIHKYSERNRELLSLIRQLAGSKAKIIHTSTQAVFGYALEIPPHPAPVKPRRDYLYIETKIELENLLLRAFSNRELHIVRLGNVWGPGSPTWTVAMTDRILFGRYVGTKGVEGYSNVTDVTNAASYLSFLVGVQSGSTPAFHHLAELGTIPWKHWIEKISTILRLEPAFYDGVPGCPRSALREFTSYFSDLSPVTLYRRLVWGRFTGSFMRSIVHLVPFKSFERMKKRKRTAGGHIADPLSVEDSVFLTIVNASTVFENHLIGNWKPPIDAEKSWKRVRDWMNEVGYLD